MLRERKIFKRNLNVFWSRGGDVESFEGGLRDKY